MTRVASLYLPDWPIERLRRAERIAALPEAPPSTVAILPMPARGDGWRPGARWARESSPARGKGPPASSGSGGGGLPQTVRLRPASSSSSTFAGPPPRAGKELRPLVTWIRAGSRMVIAAACPIARHIGIVPGMAVTQVRAQFPGLDIRPADPEGDAAALHRLAINAARRWSPLVAQSDPDGLFLDISGTAHLFGGEARMARRIVRLLARLGHTARIAVADTAGAAWALARARHPGEDRVRMESTPDILPSGPGHRLGDKTMICPPGAHAAAIAPLPAAALRIAPAAVELLKRLGVETIGELAAMPRAPLARRFGADLVIRIDQASGRIAEPLDPVIPPEHIAVVQRFAEPIATAEAIEHWLGQLMPRLVTALTEAGRGARAIELIADRIDGVPQRLRIGLARPTRDAPHLLRLIVRRIEEIAPGYGIDALHLHVRRADPLGPQPFEERLEEAPADLAPLIDMLANRIGAARLWRMRPVESDVPERSLEAAPPLDPPPRDIVRLKRDDIRQLDTRLADHPWHHRWPRPVRLLRRPERLDHVLAELPDQPPRRFTWRGQTHLITRADGPERILGEWWKRAGEGQMVRDYFQVEDEAGARFWLFRRGDGERAETGDLAWFIHGAFG